MLILYSEFYIGNKNEILNGIYLHAYTYVGTSVYVYMLYVWYTAFSIVTNNCDN